MTATQRWRAMIEAEHAQSERFRQKLPTTNDHWQPYAHQFHADPYRTNDPLLERLAQDIVPTDSVLDVGAGGGRLALPLARRCRHVTAVEPSDSMGQVLLETAADHGIRNVDLVQSTWEEAEVNPAGVVICVHVLYVVQDVARFLRKLTSHANRLVSIVLYDAPAQSQLYPLWARIRGEERLPLPSLPEFAEVLQELRINPRVELLPPQPPRGFDNVEQAVEQVSRRLYLVPGSPEEQRLQGMLPGLLEESDGVFRIKDARPLRPGLVQWETGISGGPSQIHAR